LTTPATEDLETSARAVLTAAIERRDDDAVRMIEEAVTEHGPLWLPEAMQLWIDALISHATAGGQAPKKVQVEASELSTGKVGGDLPPRVVWASKLIKARVEMDRFTFMDLIDEWLCLGNGRLAGAYLMTVLNAAALTIRHYPDGYATLGEGL
jgi:hypothetical protein